MLKQTCLKCNEEFDSAAASCGTGYTWNLTKCPKCGQLHAEGAYIPQAAIDDPDIIINNAYDSAFYNVDDKD